MTSKLDRTEITKSKEKLKKTEKRKRQQDFTHQYELETDFSNNLKALKPQFVKTDESLRPIDLPKDQFKGFSKDDQKLLKKFDFSETDIRNEKLLQ